MLKSNGMSKTTLAVIIGIFIVITGTLLAILFASGYNLDLSKKELVPTGILVATSDPDGAEVLINDELKTATNNTINLPPGKYRVKIQKDGFTSWEKEIAIKSGEVIKTNAFLFPSLADLRPLSFTGAINPILSTDKTRIVYGVASASAQLNLANPNGVWIIDMGRLNVPTPILSSADFRQIYQNLTSLSLSNANFAWSPDDKQVLAYFGNLENPTLAYLLDTDRLNNNPPEVSSTVPDLLANWQKISDQKLTAQLTRLPLVIKSSLASSSADFSFSPDETKVMYTATASAILPVAITSYLPGTDPTPEIRNLTPGNTYIYDLKEDRNYLIENCKFQISNCNWFPSSRHLVVTGKDQISIYEYDGSNQSVVFNGPFVLGKVFAWPNWSKLVILTSLGSNNGTENLYTINFR